MGWIWIWSNYSDRKRDLTTNGGLVKEITKNFRKIQVGEILYITIITGLDGYGLIEAGGFDFCTVVSGTRFLIFRPPMEGFFMNLCFARGV